MGRKRMQLMHSQVLLTEKVLTYQHYEASNEFLEKKDSKQRQGRRRKEASVTVWTTYD